MGNKNNYVYNIFDETPASEIYMARSVLQSHTDVRQ